MKLINNKVYFAVQDYLMILLGTLLYGFGFNAFILSNEIITGGVSGICALIFFASNEIIPVFCVLLRYQRCSIIGCFKNSRT